MVTKSRCVDDGLVGELCIEGKISKPPERLQTNQCKLYANITLNGMAVPEPSQWMPVLVTIIADISGSLFAQRGRIKKLGDFQKAGQLHRDVNRAVPRGENDRNFVGILLPNRRRCRRDRI